jgi:hypothetical protein
VQVNSITGDTATLSSVLTIWASPEQSPLLFVRDAGGEITVSNWRLMWLSNLTAECYLVGGRGAAVSCKIALSSKVQLWNKKRNARTLNIWWRSFINCAHRTGINARLVVSGRSKRRKGNCRGLLKFYHCNLWGHSNILSRAENHQKYKINDTNQCYIDRKAPKIQN